MAIAVSARSSRLKFALSTHTEERANLILALFAGEGLDGPAKEVDELTGGLLTRRIELDGIDPKFKQSWVIHSDLTVPGLDKIILVGLGQRSKLTLHGLRKALADAFTTSRDSVESEHVIFPLIDVDLRGFTVEQFAEVVAEYALLADYEPNHQKTRPWPEEEPQTHLKSITVLARPWTLTAAKRGINLGTRLAEATIKARNLVNEPSETKNSLRLAHVAKQIAAESQGLITTRVLNHSQIAKLGMGGLLGVNRGSTVPAVLIDMRYDPPSGKTEEVLGLVGKGITFDSGGLSIKDADSMKDMKDDMGGAAAVLYTMSLLSFIKPKVSVRAVVAATDNLVDANSVRPGDILKMMSGLTVEVNDTDAEGRLTLADALHYVQTKSGANKVIDLATLTGDVEYALGDKVTGIFGNDSAFTRQLITASRLAGEAMHELPMPEEYREGNKCEMADLTNDGEGPGAIVAAWFLREFVGEGTSWIHADIAGTSFRRYEWGVDAPGASGVGVRTLAHLLLEYS
jgi:leucyl aminopeptidase